MFSFWSISYLNNILGVRFGFKVELNQRPMATTTTSSHWRNKNLIEILFEKRYVYGKRYTYISWASASNYEKEPTDYLSITIFHTNAEHPRKWIYWKIIYFFEKNLKWTKNYDENHTNERNKERIFPFKMEHAFYFPHE